MGLRAKLDRLQLLVDADCPVIYTMGKVGSTAVEHTLSSAYHTHTLYGNPPCPHYHQWKYGSLGVLARRWLTYPLKRLMIRMRPRIRIVTMYRDPRFRNPSMFFQDLPFWLSAFSVRPGVSTRATSVDFLVDAYREVFPHDYPQTWVEGELSRFTGIPSEDLTLGNAPFSVVRRGRYEVFIGRAEELSDCMSQLAEFLGTDVGQLGVVNRSEAKWYADIYSQFLSRLKHRTDVHFCEQFRCRNGYGSSTAS